MRIRTILTLAGLSAAFAVGCANASTLYFKFSNTALGNVNGTVTGEILDLNPNGTSSPTEVLVTGYPSALVEFGSYPTPIDVSAWSGGTSEDGDTFTLSSGNFVSGSWSLTGANGIDDQLFINSGCCGSTDTNFFDIGSNDTRYVWNDNGVGSSGIQFSATPFTNTVPEPSSLALALLGAAALGLAAIRRRKLSAN
jgi:hypothetical protein